jgi:hypothetical protein
MTDDQTSCPKKCRDALKIILEKGLCRGADLIEEGEITEEEFDTIMTPLIEKGIVTATGYSGKRSLYNARFHVQPSTVDFAKEFLKKTI